MPLYVTNGKLQLGEPGKLAAQRACCCNEEGDNPEDCVCPDFCLYQIEVVSPVQTKKIPQTPCGFGNNSEQSFDASGQFPPCEDSSLCCAHSNEFYSLIPRYFFYATPFGVSNIRASFMYGVYAVLVPGTLAEIKMSASVDLVFRCTGGTGGNESWLITEPNPKLFVDIGFGIWSDSRGFYLSSPRRSVLKIGTFEVPGVCFKKANSSCDGNSAVIRGYYLEGPVEFTVSFADAGLGSWDESQTVSDQEGDQSRITPCFEALANGFSATFRITQRPSCRTVACNCSTNLDGLKATFEGKEFTLGTESSYSELFDDYELVTAHYMDFSGNYVFEKYQVMAVPAGAIGDVQMVVIYCETDDEADPPVPRWYARYESICRKYEAGGTGVVSEETKKTEIGYLPCSESAGCAGRTENDPVPLGSPIDVEEIEGSPETTDGTAACTPPARADLTIFEDCG